MLATVYNSTSNSILVIERAFVSFDSMTTAPTNIVLAADSVAIANAIPGPTLLHAKRQTFEGLLGEQEGYGAYTEMFS